MEKKEKPPVLTLDTLWNLLTRDEQIDAVRAFWSGSSPMQQTAGPRLISMLSGHLNYRESFVRKQSLEWKTTQLHKRLKRSPFNTFVDDVIREYLIERKKDMICAILDGEGTPHTDGWILDDAPPLSLETVLKGLESVRDRFNSRDLVLYYGFHLLANPISHWQSLQEAFESEAFKDLLSKVLKTQEGQQEKVPENGTALESAAGTPESSEEFTTLDNLIIKAVVAAVTDTEGGLSADALEDLIQEVIALNSDRHRSHFHTGFLDAILGMQLRIDFAGSNVTRRGWTFTGFLFGKLRSSEAGSLVDTVKSHRRVWDELMREGPANARASILPHLLSLFADEGEWGLMRDILQHAPFPKNLPQALHICALSHRRAADLVRRGNSTDSVNVLEALLGRLDRAEFDWDYMADFKAACQRKLGQAHLRAGRFPQAKQLLNKALEQHDFSEASNARSDLGLAEAGFRSLEFILPREDPQVNESTVKSLEKALPHFSLAAESEGNSTNAQFVLGLIEFHRANSEPAEQYFASALSGMLRSEEAYQAGRLIDWVKFLLAIIIAERCEPARLNEVRDLVGAAFQSPAAFPSHLWKRLGGAAALYDDKTLVISIIEHLLGKDMLEGYKLLQESGILYRNGSFRSRYRSWIDTLRLTPKKRAEELETLFEAALRDNNYPEAGEYLDALEGVARKDSAYIPSFLNLIRQNRSDILAFWDEEDLDLIEAGLLERTGQLAACGTILERLFFRFRAEDNRHMCEGILERLVDLHVAGVDLEQLREVVGLMQPSPPPSGMGTCGEIRVLYVGGDERQEHKQAKIERAVNLAEAEVKVTFYFPGWDSNWDVHLDKIKSMMPAHDVLVINTLIRTQLGRHLRALCDSTMPWRACTGPGSELIQRSIITAARWVAEING